MEKESSAAAKVHAISRIVVSAVVAVALIVSAIILAKGTYGRSETGCAVVNGGSAASASIMQRDTTMDVTMMDGDMRMGMQRASYNLDSNTVLIETPANISGSSAAAVAIDYNRKLVMIGVPSEGACFVSALGDELSSDVADFMQVRQEEAIDIASMRLDDMSYERIGEIPSGYVSASNGPIARGLCLGQFSYWTEPGQSQEGSRKRRDHHGRHHGHLINIHICIWKKCLRITL